MKFVFSLYIICFNSFISLAQTGYPEPEKTETRLFYIQHSNNHNTYVYDANLNGSVINQLEPIKEYRIIYTENGIKRPLTYLQKSRAYGLIRLDDQNNLFTFQLAASDKLDFHLQVTKNDVAKMFVTINEHKIYLEKMFIQLKAGLFSINAKADYVLFYGTDFYSGKPAMEKVLMD
ncbi:MULTISPECIES: DUF4833 domain-containing protein [Bizionia]|uniref:DUF4833 domain-containing protein n=1 Tax=Bizionia algoritergicola TaxID=291187 RepID=A0A5D0QSV5_9FLAO|nr:MULTISPECIES: DUF4833 domain-containing protein [Bizionia]OBX21965.1 DUF4833 domain-containing protein [Bizionia sp. APA-3]TYB72303.1 DUF4833 domain-containing protein [Bizionia algoritergicola]